ncbi:hypothetical protein AAFO90_10790 [Phaeobacter sp. CAU 1743]|uniref:hypothetical protein n=1 Tax=Phaeobacter sp. CAU 1743 TaxID=3140367 RepID=UPI0023B74044
MVRREIQAPLRDPVRFVITAAMGKSEMIVGIDLGTREMSAEMILDAEGKIVSSSLAPVRPATSWGSQEKPPEEITT